jgi:hypothetical protein
MIPVPLAYKYVASALMLMEINYCALRLQLPVNLPIQQQDVLKDYIFHPRVMGFQGRFDTEKYSFAFAKSGGRLCYIINLKHPIYMLAGGSPENKEYFEELTRKPSLFDSKGAYRLATNWLNAMEVDVARLERESRPTTTQWIWMNRTSVPIFEVKWCNEGKRLANGRLVPLPIVDVLISGDTGELIHLRQEDVSYSKRPVVLVKDIDKLLAIPDEEFLKYTPEQRSNLVSEFAAVQYPPITNNLINTNGSATNTSR